jgi:hypothetical protein
MPLFRATGFACLIVMAIPISAVRADVFLDTNWTTYDNWLLTTGNYFAAPFKATSVGTIETFSVLLVPVSGTGSLSGSKIEIFSDISVAPTNPANLVGTLNFSSSAPSGSRTIASYQGSVEITAIGNYFYKLSGISGNAWIRKGNPGSPSPWEIVVPGPWYLDSDTKKGDYTATYYSKFKIEGSLPPPDSDGDGVNDDADQCDSTPPSETADSSGCGPSQRDSDGDGVNDDQDVFPNDPKETADSDGDGVGDNADAFPNDPTRSAMPVPVMPALGLLLLAGLLGLLGIRRLKL